MKVMVISISCYVTKCAFVRIESSACLCDNLVECLSLLFVNGRDAFVYVSVNRSDGFEVSKDDVSHRPASHPARRFLSFFSVF